MTTFRLAQILNFLLRIISHSPRNVVQTQDHLPSQLVYDLLFESVSGKQSNGGLTVNLGLVPIRL